MRRTIFDDFVRMQDMMDRMFGESFGEPLMLGGPKNIANDYRRPLTDMYETDKEVVAQIEMPGLDKKDIKINLTDDGIEVKACKRYEKKENEKGFMRYERGYSNFYRKIPLSKEVDAKNALAEYRDGILELKMPKLDKPKQHAQIEVK